MGMQDVVIHSLGLNPRSNWETKIKQNCRILGY